MDSIKVKLVKSPIGYNPKIRKTVSALGLKKLNQVVEKKKNDAVMGMIKKVKFLLEIIEE